MTNAALLHIHKYKDVSPPQNSQQCHKRENHVYINEDTLKRKTEGCIRINYYLMDYVSRVFFSPQPL